MFSLQSLDFQTDQSVQTHLQNGSCLSLCKAQHGCHLFGDLGFELDVLRLSPDQAGLCIFYIFTSTQDLDDQIDHVAGLNQPFLHFLLFLLFCKKCPVLSGRKFKLKIHMMFDDLFQT